MLIKIKGLLEIKSSLRLIEFFSIVTILYSVFVLKKSNLILFAHVHSTLSTQVRTIQNLSYNRVFPKVDHSARIVLGQLLN